MFFSGIASLIVRRIRREWLKDAGLKLGPRRFYIQAYAQIYGVWQLIFPDVNPL
jgi:hypothetical protein